MTQTHAEYLERQAAFHGPLADAIERAVDGDDEEGFWALMSTPGVEELASWPDGPRLFQIAESLSSAAKWLRTKHDDSNPHATAFLAEGAISSSGWQARRVGDPRRAWRPSLGEVLYSLAEAYRTRYLRHRALGMLANYPEGHPRRMAGARWMARNARRFRIAGQWAAMHAEYPEGQEAWSPESPTETPEHWLRYVVTPEDLFRDETGRVVGTRSR